MSISQSRMRTGRKLGQVKYEPSDQQMMDCRLSDTPGTLMMSNAFVATARRTSTRGCLTKPIERPPKHGQSTTSGANTRRSVPTSCSSLSITGTCATVLSPTSSRMSGRPARRTSRSSTISACEPRPWQRTPVTCIGVPPSEKRSNASFLIGVPFTSRAKIGLRHQIIVSSVAAFRYGQYFLRKVFSQSARSVSGNVTHDGSTSRMFCGSEAISWSAVPVAFSRFALSMRWRWRDSYAVTRTTTRSATITLRRGSRSAAPRQYTLPTRKAASQMRASIVAARVPTARRVRLGVQRAVPASQVSDLNLKSGDRSRPSGPRCKY